MPIAPHSDSTSTMKSPSVSYTDSVTRFAADAIWAYKSPAMKFGCGYVWPLQRAVVRSFVRAFVCEFVRKRQKQASRQSQVRRSWLWQRPFLRMP